MSKKTTTTDSGWQLEDEVVTTYRSIHLARVQAEGRGIQQERYRILRLLDLLPTVSAGNTQMISISKDALIELIENGASN